ncbi:MAG: putative AAA+ superfamily ATPase [Phenylobacterium sp.]|jgi:predicted AAA+ superfamily ATPase
MHRTLLDKLVNWKTQPDRMPLLLDGARQVGKSYLLEHLFGRHHFKKVIKLDFLANPSFADFFADSKNPQDILARLQISQGIDFEPTTDLLLLDEIGECQQAMDSLKFFQEQRPDIFVCASGSNIGLLDSFPVGKVQELRLYPFSFEEFVIAHNNPHLSAAFQAGMRSDVIHQALWPLLLDYYFVGGMPKAVATWIKGDQSKVNALAAKVRRIQQDLINGYIRDFGKFTNSKSTAMHIERIFRNIPIQLSREIDGSVNRYQFSNIIPKKNGYQDLQGPIEYLVKARLASKNYTVEGTVHSPLSTLISQSRFKLFLLDVGLLHCMLELNYQEIKLQHFDFKGYMAENFVQNEALTLGLNHTYSWKSQRMAELEFLFKRPDGEIIPVEVKSGKRTQAKSLSIYIQKYQPKTAYKFTANIGGFRDDILQTQPLYYARFHLNQLINANDE